MSYMKHNYMNHKLIQQYFNTCACMLTRRLIISSSLNDIYKAGNYRQVQEVMQLVLEKLPQDSINKAMLSSRAYMNSCDV